VTLISGQRSLKVIESGTIRKIVYGFLLVFFSNIVPWDIRLQNYRDFENRVMGPPRSLEMSPCDRAHMTSYWRSTVTMALSRVVSEIFNVEKCRDFQMGVKGHSRSLRVVSFDRSIKFIISVAHCRLDFTDSFLLMFFSNFVLKTHRFWDNRLQKCSDHENRVRGPSRSLEISPFDRGHMTSYWRSIVTMALFSVVSDIFNV